MTPGAGPDGPASLTAGDVVPASSAEALHNLLDLPGEAPADGAALPPLWHWLAFRPTVAQAELGRDGHPRTGLVVPPAALPRRMFAGGRLRFAAPLRVGEPLVRRSAVTGVEDKEGRSGPLRFVHVRHELSAGVAEAVVEEQDLVYRPDLQAPAAPAAPEPPAERADELDWPWRWDLAIDPTLLFRFSALTYNAHRIHYDRDYASGVEGYPGLVVHGPLQAVGLAELVRREEPERPVAAFRFRSFAPVFDDGPLLLRGRPGDDDTIELASLSHDGRVAMRADATLA